MKILTRDGSIPLGLVGFCREILDKCFGAWKFLPATVLFHLDLVDVYLSKHQVNSGAFGEAWVPDDLNGGHLESYFYLIAGLTVTRCAEKSSKHKVTAEYGQYRLILGPRSFFALS